MLRNLDAAWDIAGGRQLAAFFAVEGEDPDPSLAPNHWQQAAQATISEEAMAGSLPHRSEEVRQRMAECFLGAVTWQAICRDFALPPEVLIDEVHPDSVD